MNGPNSMDPSQDKDGKVYTCELCGSCVSLADMASVTKGTQRGTCDECAADFGSAFADELEHAAHAQPDTELLSFLIATKELLEDAHAHSVPDASLAAHIDAEVLGIWPEIYSLIPSSSSSSSTIPSSSSSSIPHHLASMRGILRRGADLVRSYTKDGYLDALPQDDGSVHIRISHYGYLTLLRLLEDHLMTFEQPYTKEHFEQPVSTNPSHHFQPEDDYPPLDEEDEAFFDPLLSCLKSFGGAWVKPQDLSQRLDLMLPGWQDIFQVDSIYDYCNAAIDAGIVRIQNGSYKLIS
eukprot:TRINITY_DN524_c0_g1_i1.p1 TRINITY_DN524_c0_g1~~TRINITY_DN524_c0_g1_i1.p1  ORF type:complete len:295 (-),score=55.28 TRINITY_DN524_c0_g1_i1:337-1221(-)